MGERGSRESLASIRLALAAYVLRHGGLFDMASLFREAARVLRSGIWDAPYYVAEYPDVRAFAPGPLIHYLVRGAAEGRNPHPLFDAEYYRAQVDPPPHVMSPLGHFLDAGADAASPHPLFNADYYLEQTPAPAARQVHPLLQFLARGTDEKGSPSPYFDVDLYRAQHAEGDDVEHPLVNYLRMPVAQRPRVCWLIDPEFYRQVHRLPETIDPVIHYVRHGWREGRQPHQLFDPRFYRASNPDLSTNRDPLEHFLRVGGFEDRRPSPWFDTAYYRANYPDVARSKINPLVHYLALGWRERRNPGSFFNTGYYLDRNPDLRNSEENPLTHWVRQGRTQGRLPREGRKPRSPWTRDLTRSEIERRIELLADQPLISVIMPTYNIDPRWVEAAVRSVLAQYYGNWELCICDDGSTREDGKALLRDLSTEDPRIKVVWSESNGGISVATNKALSLASGAWVAFLDADDELTPDALFWVAEALNAYPDAEVFYTDHDKTGPDGALFESAFKPAWSLEMFRAVMYICHLLVVKRAIVDEVGGFDTRFDKVQDYEFMLRVTERTSRIVHLPRTTYHWRAIPGSGALTTSGKAHTWELQVEAVRAHMCRCGVEATVSPHPLFEQRAVVRPPGRWAPSGGISLIIPTKDQPEHIGRCLESIFTRSTCRDIEVIIVDTGTTDSRALAILDAYPVSVLRCGGPFNFSHANNAGVSKASGRYLVLLNNDTEVQSPDWLEVLTWHLELPNVAAVGPLLLYPDGGVQHAGIVLGLRGTADHVMRRFPSDSDGYLGSLSSTREVSAVTAACMALRREDYTRLGGLSDYYGTIYQDVDLCLQLRADERRILFTPHAVLTHHESASRGSDYDQLDRALLLSRWGRVIEQGDPFYNPNFVLDHEDFYSTM